MREKSLVIGEKPSMARSIADVIMGKNQQKKDGYIEGEDYIVTWAIGHLVTLKTPGEYDKKYEKWRLEDLPFFPEPFEFKPISNTKSHYEKVKKLIHRSDVTEIINAGDAAIEGEAIIRNLLVYAGNKKKSRRLWISSLTDEKIKEGFKKLEPSYKYDNLYKAAKCRMYSDFLVGISATRAYSLVNNATFTVGRVQTPTLSMIVNRDREITNFVPEDYFEVKTTYNNDFEWHGKWIDIKTKNTRFSEKEKAEEVANKVRGKDGKIVHQNEKEGTIKPPLLYDLTTLQRDANKTFGYSAKKTLGLAQSLYETHKMTTYPRTDSRYLPEDMKNEVLDTLEKLQTEPFNNWIDPIIGDINTNNKDIFNDKEVSDHFAIIPTNKKPDHSKLSKEEKEIYIMIVKRFVSVFYPKYRYLSKTIIVQSQAENFFSKGKTVLDSGWKSLYQDEEKEKEVLLPNLQKGDIVKIDQAAVESKQTKPPKHYTENSLLNAMEGAGKEVDDEELKKELKEKGIGTPATRAEIIEKLIKTKYVERKGKGKVKTLLATEKAHDLYDVIPNELRSAEITGIWERGLQRMAKGQYADDSFLESARNFTRFLVDEAKKHKIEGASKEKYQKSSSEKKVIGECPVCREQGREGKILKHKNGYGCDQFQSGCSFFIGSKIAKRKMKVSEVRDLINKGKTAKLEGFISKKDKPFSAVLKCNTEKQKIDFSFD